MGWPQGRRMPGTGRVQTRGSSQNWGKRESERRLEEGVGDEGTKGKSLRHGCVGTGQRDARQATDGSVLLHLSIRKVLSLLVPEPRLESTGLESGAQRLVIAL